MLYNIVWEFKIEALISSERTSFFQFINAN